MSIQGKSPGAGSAAGRIVGAKQANFKGHSNLEFRVFKKLVIF